jgi:hypothetical protein
MPYENVELRLSISNIKITAFKKNIMSNFSYRSFFSVCDYNLFLSLKKKNQ